MARIGNQIKRRLNSRSWGIFLFISETIWLRTKGSQKNHDLNFKEKVLIGIDQVTLRIILPGPIII